MPGTELEIFICKPGTIALSCDLLLLLFFLLFLKEEKVLYVGILWNNVFVDFIVKCLQSNIFLHAILTSIPMAVVLKPFQVCVVFLDAATEKPILQGFEGVNGTKSLIVRLFSKLHSSFTLRQRHILKFRSWFDGTIYQSEDMVPGYLTMLHHPSCSLKPILGLLCCILLKQYNLFPHCL